MRNVTLEELGLEGSSAAMNSVYSSRKLASEVCLADNSQVNYVNLALCSDVFVNIFTRCLYCVLYLG